MGVFARCCWVLGGLFGATRVVVNGSVNVHKLTALLLDVLYGTGKFSV